MNNEDTKQIPKIDENTTTLTDEQVEDIAQQMDDAIKGTSLEDLANLPSNQGKLERSEDERMSTPGESKMVKVAVNQDTGEHAIVGTVDKNNETFEEIVDRLSSDDFEVDQSPISEEELNSFIKNESDVDGVLKEITADKSISNESVKKLLEIVNRKMSNETFNIYNEFPDEIKKMIDKYIIDGNIPLYSDQGRQLRKIVSEALINECITNISIDRLQHDFNKELEELFEKGSEELADNIIGYTTERNQRYREYAEQLDDEEKKQKILAILDQIDEAYNLTKLKEFASNCKIKNIELEKPNRVYDTFLFKYINSTYSIYDIKLAVDILLRNFTNKYSELSITKKDIDGFFICFCKQCLNMSPNIVTDHAYMYYVLYNAVITDINKGESSEISEKFLKNITEVIVNLRARNPKLLQN